MKGTRKILGIVLAILISIGMTLGIDQTAQAETILINVGQTRQILLDATLTTGKLTSGSWSSSDGRIAKITSQNAGFCDVLGVSSGTATITCRYRYYVGGKYITSSWSCMVKVSESGSGSGGSSSSYYTLCFDSSDGSRNKSIIMDLAGKAYSKHERLSLFTYPQTMLGFDPYDQEWYEGDYYLSIDVTDKKPSTIIYNEHDTSRTGDPVFFSNVVDIQAKKVGAETVRFQLVRIQNKVFYDTIYTQYGQAELDIQVICSHKFDDGVVIQEASATQNKIVEYTCDICGEKMTEEILSPASVVSAPVPCALTYNGFAQELVSAGVADGGTMYYALGTDSDAAPDGSAYTTSIPTGTNVGTYYVWHKIIGDSNHCDSEPDKVSVKISPVDKSALNTAIAGVETYYNSIMDYTDIASSLKIAIDTAKALAGNDNVTESDVAKAISTINDALDTARIDVKKVDEKRAAEEAAKAVTDAINALGDNPTKEAVEAARAAYEKLTEAQKALVPADVLSKLTTAESKVKAAEEDAAADEAAAKAVTDAINALGDKPSKEAVEAARAAYDKLTDAQKALVPADVLSKLTTAESKVKAAEEDAAADEAAAKAVTDAINVLGDKPSKEAVEAARAAYDKLTDAQKALVPAEVLAKLTTAEEVTRTIDITDCEITVNNVTYTGKAVKAKAMKKAVTVKYDGNKLTEGADYTFTYNKKAKAIGAYKLTVTGMGRYIGSVNMTFNVVPKGTAFSKVTGGDKQVTLKWKSQKNITGYQIEYSLKKDFSGSKKVTVKKAKTLTTTIKKLKAGKTYYVRIRTYTTVKKKNYFSAWSKAKAVKTKTGKAKNNSTVPNIEVTMNVGERMELSPLVAPDASDTILTWTTSDETIATVSQDGVVTALLPGEVVITATIDEGEQVRITVRVNKSEGVILLDLGDNDFLLDVDDEFGEEVIMLDEETTVEIEEPVA